MSQMKSKITAARSKPCRSNRRLLRPIVTRDQNENFIRMLKKDLHDPPESRRLPLRPLNARPQVRYTPVDFTFSGPVAMLARSMSLDGRQCGGSTNFALIKEQPQLVSMLDKLDPDALYDYIMDRPGLRRHSTGMRNRLPNTAGASQAASTAQKLSDGQSCGALQKGAKAPEEGSPSEAIMGINDLQPDASGGHAHPGSPGAYP